jgi:hypothetical protein
VGEYLLMDDGNFLQECIAALVAAGFNTIPVEDGLEAWFAYQTNIFHTTPIIINIAMPTKGCFKVFRIIEEQNHYARIILFYGYVDHFPTILRTPKLMFHSLGHFGADQPERNDSHCNPYKNRDWAKGWTRSLNRSHRHHDV